MIETKMTQFVSTASFAMNISPFHWRCIIEEPTRCFKGLSWLSATQWMSWLLQNFGIWHPHLLNEAAELSSYCPLHALPLSVPLDAWFGIVTLPKSPSKLICCTSADDNIFILWTQLTNSLQEVISWWSRKQSKFAETVVYKQLRK